MRVPSLNKKRWTLLLLLISSLVLVTTLFVTSFFKVYQVVGNSMLPTFTDREIIVLRKISLERGALAVFSPPEEWSGKTEFFFKRVIAIPGDEVIISKEVVTVNGVEVSTSLGDCEQEFREIIDGVIVVGDNQAHSIDSISSWCEETINPVVPIDKIRFVGKRLL